MSQNTSNSTQPYYFQVGDIGELGGILYRVIGINPNENDPFRLECVREGSSGTHIKYFTLDGRFLLEHTTPSLILKQKAKRKIHTVAKKWVNIYKGGEIHLTDTKEEADFHARPDRIGCQMIVIEYDEELED